MLKGMAWSLLSGGFLAAGFAYVYAHRARARRVAGDSERRLLAAVDTRNQLLKEALEEPLPADVEEIEIELLDLDLDIDAMAGAEAEEAYDSTSPDGLGALWLARATQTSGVHTSPSFEDEDFDAEDDLDPAGRPTEPPQERSGLPAKD